MNTHMKKIAFSIALRTSLAAALTAVLVACAVAAAESAAPTPLPGPHPLDVTVGDVTAAGYSGVKVVDPLPNRFLPPVHYFRVTESLNDVQAKKDCADCRNLLAVYAAVSQSVPGWSINQRVFIRPMGGRTQVRYYLPDKKIIIIATGPDPKLTVQLADFLKAKLSK